MSAPADPAPLAGAADLAAVREDYLDRLAASDEQGAVAVALAAVDAGHDTEDVLLDVIAEAQREVGERWAAGTWSVVQEHIATHISERVVAAVSRHRPAGGPTGVGRIAVACLDGEWHGLPARLLAEVLVRHGWEVSYLGSSVPAAQVAMHLNAAGPDVVAVSSSLPSRLPAARRVVEACRATGTPVLAGGPAFGPDGEWARSVGADGWAPDARAAVALLDSPSLTGDQDAVTVDDTSREEQALLQGRRGELVAGVASRLRDEPSEELTDDLGHLVDFLAAAVYVDDAGLLARFVRWIGSVVVPGGLTGDEVGRALDELATRLGDSPRTTALIRSDAVREACAGLREGTTEGSA
ncbi:cobalamin-dependent protein [Actinomycetospora sp. TBRC 11914]|uniref:cobalamin B12-binding domain-containing protein n=1 Tax=Actinomycetospora sp. TBRC 11914 TaxID=2729387 RepID=UPI00145E76C7|nr:cobalamin-dependent protein [Actinomycetospora sp. TBRC 11914]NMO92897.1 cobalamin B12-binding domain-containing protein [Actinomycetospora sp. TBRC 11914]